MSKYGKMYIQQFTYEENLLLIQILLIQDTESSNDYLIDYCFNSIIYDLMYLCCYEGQDNKINYEEGYKKFLNTLNDGECRLNEIIKICLLSSHKRSNLNLIDFIDKGMLYLKLNSKKIGTLHSNFINYLGYEHIEVLIKKLIQNLYTSPKVYNQNIILKVNNVILCNSQLGFLDIKNYKFIKGSNTDYYINRELHEFYSDKIFVINSIIDKVTKKVEYSKFRTFLKIRILFLNQMMTIMTVLILNILR